VLGVRAKEVTMTKTLFETIASDLLADPVGGKKTTSDIVLTPVGIRAKLTEHQEPSETAMESNSKSAYEAYPDNRWFWQRWRGDEDPNAKPRADWLADQNRRVLK
jgi:hypothetical protein